MPLYEYVCKNCNQRVEMLQRIGEDASGLACPGCGEKKLEKQLSTFSSGSSDSTRSSVGAASGCGPGAGFT